MPFRRFRRAARGDASGASNEALAAQMVGEWTHARPPSASPQAPSLNAGIFVSIAIDSARGMQFWGRVTRWIVGDVGLSANRFGLVTGTLDAAYGVVLQIEPGSSPIAATFRIEGELRGDLLVVSSSWTDAAPGPFPVGCRFQRLH